MFDSFITYDINDTTVFRSIIKKARQKKLCDAIKKFESFEPVNETLFGALLPAGTVKPVIKKRVNKLRKMKLEKDLKRLIG